jgi:dolichol-phosphate mannosyltransferase
MRNRPAGGNSPVMSDEMISIVVPTYNERDNIVPLVERLSRTLAGRNFEILLVDDNSKDGTVDVAAALAEEYPVKVMVRTNERGLATAVLHGFKYAKGDIIGVMDADLQHPPEVNAHLLNALESGADMAVASRYVPGGGCPNWGLTRRAISKGALTLAHIFLPTTRKVKDPMSGFFMFRRSGMEQTEFKPAGYKILLEMLVMGKFQNVVEVPFIFEDRSSGASKMKARQQLDYLKHIFSLMRRKGELWRFLKFIGVGLSGVVVNLGLYALLTRVFGIYDILAQAISVEVSIISNFSLNDYFTFSDRRMGKNKSFINRLLRFNLVSLIGYGLNLGIFALFTRVFHVYDIISLLIAIVVIMIWNYILSNVWTWR